jgi:hypothetical protein
MSGDIGKQIVKSTGGGFFQDIGTRIKLIIRLLRDKRVSFFLKLLPLSTLVYLVFPDFMPFVIDDALIMWLGTYLFVELVPDEIVDEHLRALQKRLTPATPQPSPEEPQVVDAEFHEVDETKS